MAATRRDPADVPRYVEARSALTDAAQEIKKTEEQAGANPIMPRRFATRAEEDTSHFIPESDLVRFEMASDTNAGPALQLALGALLGATAPFLTTLATICLNWGEWETLGAADLVNTVTFVAAGASSGALGFVHKKPKETVKSICKEIRERQRMAMEDLDE